LPERHEAAPRRTYRLRKPKDPEKEAFKERILAKAKARNGEGGKTVRKCKACGEPGHRSDTCPNKAKKGDEGFSTYDDE